ncbi:hypothetical protein SBADM41S_02206 [Streptomyces badius]
MMIHAPKPGANVREESIYYMPIYGSVRPALPGGGGRRTAATARLQVRPQVQIVAMKMLTVVRAPTAMNAPLSTFSSSRLT